MVLMDGYIKCDLGLYILMDIPSSGVFMSLLGLGLVDRRDPTPALGDVGWAYNVWGGFT